MKILTKPELIMSLSEVDLYPDFNRVKDLHYVIFDHGWLVNEFLPWWAYHKKQTGLVYKKQQNDCDDIAERFKVKLKEALRQNPASPEAASSGAQIGLAVPDAYSHDLWIGGRHELNLVLTTQSWQIIEPQNERIAPVLKYPFRQFLKHDEIEF